MTTIADFPLASGDLAPFVQNVDSALAEELITMVVARASLVAPEILADNFPADRVPAVRAILLDAVVRRYDARKLGMVAGTSTSEASGGRSHSSDAKSLPLLLASEIADLQALAREVTSAAPSVSAPVYSFPAAQGWPDPACWPYR